MADVTDQAGHESPGGGDAGDDLGSTTLPAATARPRNRTRLLLVAGTGVLVVLIVLALLLRGHSSTSGGTAATGTERTGTPAIADSQTKLTDSADVQHEVAALLRRSLPHSGPTFPSTAVAPAKDVLLAPSLRLDDPALPACAAEIEDGGALLGIDRVSYQGEASLLIVTTGDTDDQAIAWVVGQRCAEPGAGGIRTIVTTAR